MQGSAELLVQLKPRFASQHKLQAIGLSGRQLPLITKNQDIMPYLFNAAGVRYVEPHPNGDASQRILLLNVSSASPTPDVVVSAVQQHKLELITEHTLELGYEHLSSDQILEALLPTPVVASDGVPTSFTIVGHIAHLNLLPVFLPFRFLIGHVLLSKHASTLRTVVNKLDSIDTQFRYFAMELLAGTPEYIATVSESDCLFEFDFRSVYWNSRLHAEHMRLIEQCRPNQVLADVMAGVGPFAVPAAKRGTWVLANDLNPSSWQSLEKNARKNKVLLGEKRDGDGGLVAMCMDGREFVRWSMEEAWRQSFAGRVKGFDGEHVDKEDQRLRESARKAIKDKAKAQRAGVAAELTKLNLQEPERHMPRRLVDHFVMNLPATALEFLDAFRGAYTRLADAVGHQALETELDLRSSSPDRSLHPYPLIHVHCFSKDPFTPALDILTRANAALGLSPSSPHRLTSQPIPPPHQTLTGLRKPSQTSSYLSSHPNYPKYHHLTDQKTFMSHVQHEWSQRDNAQHTPGLSIHYVRDVAPNKQMYCLSFPCPKEVLWEQLVE